MASKVREQLAKRLQDEFELRVTADDFQRTYAGINMRRRGAFVWVFVNPNINGVVGGCEPASKYIIKKNRLEIQKGKFNEIEVYVYAPDDVGYA